MSKSTGFSSGATLLSAAALAIVIGGMALNAAAQSVAPTASGGWLVDAARNSETEAARVFIAHGADVDHFRSGDGTPLIVAAAKGDIAMVRLLLEQDANVNKPAAGDGNPLIAAAAHGHTEVVDYLIAQGADVNAIVVDDETALINAAREGHLETVRHLVARGADVNLAVRVDLRSGGTELRSPLSQAHRNRHHDVSAFLISQGARR
ncbi:ankyrin repeat domain-containing protein [Brevundimonas naejangsanensis]|nr:ankyrin repeat domain-containing protein [Brevundimonas naejangsanensis]